MNTAVFGPLAWSVLQTTPRIAPFRSPHATELETSAPQAQAAYTERDDVRETLNVFYQALPYLIPCRWCRASCTRFVECISAYKWLQRPPRLTRGGTEYWMYLVHNLVNQKLDKRWYTDKALVYDGAVWASRDAYLCALLEWLTVVLCDLPIGLLAVPPREHATEGVAFVSVDVARAALEQWARDVVAPRAHWLDEAQRDGVALMHVVNAHVAHAHARMHRADVRADQRYETQRGVVSERAWTRVAWAMLYIEHLARLLRMAPDDSGAPLGSARLPLVVEQPLADTWRRKRHALADALHAWIAERPETFLTRDAAQRALHDARATVFPNTCPPFAQACSVVQAHYNPPAPAPPTVVGQ